MSYSAHFMLEYDDSPSFVYPVTVCTSIVRVNDDLAR